MKISTQILEAKMILGEKRGKTNSLFFLCSKKTNIALVPKKNSVFLFNLKTNLIIVNLKCLSNPKKTLVVMNLSSIFNFQTIYILIGFDDGTIIVWKLDWIKKLIFNVYLNGHTKPITKLMVFEKKWGLISGCKKGNIIFWNLVKKSGILKIKEAHRGEINGLIFQKAGLTSKILIISSGTDNLLKIWNWANGTCKKIIRFMKYTIKDLFFFDHDLFSVSFDKNITGLGRIDNNLECLVFGYLKRAHVNILEKEFICIKSNFIIYYGGKDLNIFLVKKDLMGGEKILEISALKNIRNFLEGPVVFTLERKITGIDLWKKPVGKEIFFLLQYSNPEALDLLKFSIKKKSANSNNYRLNRVIRRNFKNHKSEIREILWFANDSFVLSLCSASKDIHSWNVDSQKCVKIVKVFSYGLCLDFFDLTSVLMGTKNGNIEIYDIFSGNLIWKKINAHNGPIWTIEFSKNSQFLCSGGYDGILRIWESRFNEIVLSKKLFLNDQIILLKTILERNVLITVGLSSKILVFKIDTLEFSFSFQGHILPVISMAISNNFKILGTSSIDKTLRLWNIPKKNLIKLVLPGDAIVTSIVFQLLSKNLFTGSRNGSIKYWQINNFHLLTELNFHNGPIWAIKLSETGKYLATGSQDKLMIIWKISKINKKENNNNFSKDFKKTENLKRLIGKLCKNFKKSHDILYNYILISFYLYEFLKEASMKIIKSTIRILSSEELKFFVEAIFIILDSKTFFDCSFVIGKIHYFVSLVNDDNFLREYLEMVAKIKKKILVYLFKNEKESIKINEALITNNKLY
jgi:U3 small nucleolar RNA-associated protein 12